MIECPTCDSGRIRTELIQHTFKYGVGDGAKDLTCQLPLRICQDCGIQFIDEVGEAARHDAVCRYLGLMTPSEIQAVRRQEGATQTEFNELTGIGEASLSRWENGASLQSKAYDNYLYLLTVPENIRRLKDRAAGFRTATSDHPTKARFRRIEITEARIARQRQFVLRPTG